MEILFTIFDYCAICTCVGNLNTLPLNQELHSPYKYHEKLFIILINNRIYFFLSFTAFDSLPKSHLLYNVRSKSFPSGTHLILSHHNAKVLQELNPEYKIHRQPVVYRNENGKLVKDRMNRHKRNSHKRDISHAIAGCCNNELSCLMAMCLVRHF